MCQVVTMKVGNRQFQVAEIKKPYMENIIDAAQKCDFIDRIILFGSSIEERCWEQSDIDLAVFGTHTRSRAFSSKKYERFVRQIYRFNDFAQDYDILYFKTGSNQKDQIMNDIQKGEVLYERSAE